MKPSLELKQTQQLHTKQIKSLDLLSFSTSQLKEQINNELTNNFCLLEKEASSNPIIQNENYNYDKFPSQKKSLIQSLTEQISINTKDEKQLKNTLKLLDYLDENGLFSIPKEQLAKICSFNKTSFEKALNIIQSCTPLGVGTFSTSQCLILQLEEIKSPSSKLAKKILQKSNQVSTKKQLEVLAKELKVSLEEIKRAFKLIKKLNPTPTYQDTARFIQPEIIIERQNSLHIITYNRWFPELNINLKYLEILKNKTISQTDLAHIKEKMQRAKDLISHIQNRLSTLKKIAQFILSYQEIFFTNNLDEKYMLPLSLAKIAQSLNLHTSTISRATQNKYIQLPNQKIVPFKYFLSFTINEKYSRQTIKKAIISIIASEDKNSPYSDSKIEKKLLEKEIKISRRTIAKYRNELSIGNTQERKLLAYLEE